MTPVSLPGRIPAGTNPVVVIGAGLAGLAAACHLRAQGRPVVVVEREPLPGGRAGQLELDGFTFDTGPSVLTMVNLVDDALRAVGTTVADELTVSQLDPAYRAVFADGSTLHVRAGHEAMRAEIEEHCGAADARAFDGFVDWLRRLYEIEMPHFIDANFNSAADLLRRPDMALRLLRLGGFGKLGPAVRRRFADQRLHRLFSFQAMYAGLAPDQALAIYAVITYMDSIEGVFFPADGMHAVPTALAIAAERAGVEFRYRSTVTELLRRGHDGAVCGVRLEDGSTVAADAVVCTLDAPTVWSTLLADLQSPAVLRHPSYSPSAVVWHVGVRGLPPAEAAHHNIHFGQQWAGAFDELLTAGTLMSDPSRLVCIPSLDTATAAPEGSSALFVLEPVPNLAVGTIDWQTEAPRMRQRLLDFLTTSGYPTSDIVVDRLVTPLDWQDQGMAAGTPFALAHTFRQTGPFRPGNTDRRVPGLVLAGSGTVPGVGVPMVLVSGKLAAQRVAEYLP